MRELLDLIFPPRCAGCDRPGALLCERCRAVVPQIDGSRACDRCGAPLARDGRCHECVGRLFAFSAARCAALLEPPVSRAVVLLKDGGERRYARVLGELLAGAAAGWLTPADVLVPVPASPAAVRRRGFDHAADIARTLSVITGNRVERMLSCGASADQRTLGREERFTNRADAFRLVPGAAVISAVVLVDDVFTTGATLDAAASVIRRDKGVSVRALAVARTCAASVPPATLTVLSPGSVVAGASAP